MLVSMAMYRPALSCRRYLEMKLKGMLPGWHSYTAAALRDYGSLQLANTIAISPSPCGKISIYEVPITQLNTSIVNVDVPAQHIVRSIYVADCKATVTVLEKLAKLASSDTLILWLHGLYSIPFTFFTLNCFYKIIHVLRRGNKVDYMVLAEQHAAPPPHRYNLVLGVRGYVVIPFVKKALNMLERVKPGYIVIDKLSHNYLKSLYNLHGRILYQHVGIPYDTISPDRVKPHPMTETLRLKCDYIVATYTEIAHTHGGRARGADLLPYIAKKLRKRGICLVVAGIPRDEKLVQQIVGAGAIVVGFRPHSEFLRLLAGVDAYILAARPSYYHGGIGVTTIEALALNKPVVSPVLEHVPSSNAAEKMGVKTPWIRNLRDVEELVVSVASVLKDFDKFESRKASIVFYDVKMFAKRVSSLITQLLS